VSFVSGLGSLSEGVSSLVFFLGGIGKVNCELIQVTLARK
jgi:hypothetical protein